MSFTSLQLDSIRHTGLDQHAVRWGTPSGALGGDMCAIALGLDAMIERPALPAVGAIGRRAELESSTFVGRQEAIKAEQLGYQQSAARNGAAVGSGGRIH